MKRLSYLGAAAPIVLASSAASLQPARLSAPLLIVGDNGDRCLDPSIFLKRTEWTAELLVLPRSARTITSEEPAAFNATL